jgi:hypothetical protein
MDTVGMLQVEYKELIGGGSEDEVVEVRGMGTMLCWQRSALAVGETALLLAALAPTGICHSRLAAACAMQHAEPTTCSHCIKSKLCYYVTAPAPLHGGTSVSASLTASCSIWCSSFRPGRANAASSMHASGKAASCASLKMLTLSQRKERP